MSNLENNGKIREFGQKYWNFPEKKYMELIKASNKKIVFIVKTLSYALFLCPIKESN